ESGKWRVGVTSLYTENPDICDCSDLVPSRCAHLTHIHGRLAAATLNRFCAVEYALLGRLRGSCHAYSPQNLEVTVAGDVVAREASCRTVWGAWPMWSPGARCSGRACTSSGVPSSQVNCRMAGPSPRCPRVGCLSRPYGPAIRVASAIPAGLMCDCTGSPSTS